MNNSSFVSPGAGSGLFEQPLDSAADVRCSVVRVSASSGTPWRRHSATTIVLLCCEGRLRLDLDMPFYSVVLEPGEIYTLPPNLSYRIQARDGDVAFLVVQAGLPWDAQAVDVEPGSRDEFLMPRKPREMPRLPTATNEELSDYWPGYSVKVLARNDLLRVLVLGLEDGHCVPWHLHESVDDRFFCMRGVLRIETDRPREGRTLLPGQSYCVPAVTPHFVSGAAGQTCEFLVIQGTGRYNYVETEVSCPR